MGILLDSFTWKYWNDQDENLYPVQNLESRGQYYFTESYTYGVIKDKELTYLVFKPIVIPGEARSLPKS